ncbi:MAG: peptidase M23 [Rhodobacteraceae bacterium]|nr:peptidase M23 [Paracoccaceae bacterium]
MTLRAALLCLMLVAPPAVAQGLDDIAAAEAARLASQEIEKAARALDAADSARDRVAALTQTVQAFENGLEALRDGMRRAALREARLTRELQAREGEVAELLGALQSMSRAPAPTTLLHPAGPMGTARAGMILSDVAPAMNVWAQELRAKLEEVQTLRTLQESAAETLGKGLQGVQEARSELSQAVASRVPLPKKFTEDPVRTAILIASTETLEGFASGLSEMAVDEAEVILPDVRSQRGNLPLPVAGTLLRRAGEADAAGVKRPGILLAARPRALVTSPAAGTIRYRGPLLDYGNVIILEPGPGILLVLAGLDVVYGETGDVLPEGSPLGLMGGAETAEGSVVPQNAEGTGSGRPETLYMELRVDNVPEDPAPWFRELKDG